MKKLDSRGRTVGSLGDVTQTVDKILNQAHDIVKTAYEVMVKIEKRDKDLSWFDKTRTKLSFIALQVLTGKQSVVLERAWTQTMISKISSTSWTTDIEDHA
ncbi:hypothetical protein NUU61_005286 [Penicillium alfredii]|uniref:Uncharacterized protein n=1 Tax=Penicillium alfredii TaxID=1506179 RepID=A0A9W9F937_9EURO|nr:uncharacterized protein NUU61_005286 [Penicillium alfredii]KAJ5095930.1 hypothetical protein NUU61_005286 [Penicillium alfredii]